MAHEDEPIASQMISITPLLARLWPSPEETNVTAEEIALAISHIFTNQL
jgi:anthranilate phosphoribosyltransferase